MKFIENVFEKLRHHPKRVVFPEGSEPRIVAAASEYVSLGLGIAVLLGKSKEIEQVAEDANIKLKNIHIIDPETAEANSCRSKANPASFSTLSVPRTRIPLYHAPED